MKYNRKRLLTNEFIYAVFREIALNEDETYPTKIARDLERYGGDEITKICNSLAKEGFVSKGDREKAQYYRLNPEKLELNFVELWRNENVDIESELTSELVIKYVRSYCDTNKNSTIQDMILGDFYTSVKLAKKHSDRDYSLLTELNKKLTGFEGDSDPGEHILDALTSILDKS